MYNFFTNIMADWKDMNEAAVGNLKGVDVSRGSVSRGTEKIGQARCESGRYKVHAAFREEGFEYVVAAVEGAGIVGMTCEVDTADTFVAMESYIGAITGSDAGSEFGG